MKLDGLYPGLLAPRFQELLDQNDRLQSLLSQSAPYLDALSKTATDAYQTTPRRGLLGTNTFDATSHVAEMLGPLSGEGLLNGSSVSRAALRSNWLDTTIPDLTGLFSSTNVVERLRGQLKTSSESIQWPETASNWLHAIPSTAALRSAVPAGLLDAYQSTSDFARLTRLSDQLQSSISSNIEWIESLRIRTSATQIFADLSRLTDSADRVGDLFSQLPRNHEIFANGFPYAAPHLERFTGAHLVERLATRSADADCAAPDRARVVEKIGGVVGRQIEASLWDLGGDFLRLMLGARAASTSTNPDKSRHVCVSLRELLTGVLHELSPDEEVIRTLAGPELIKDGRPTRRGRVLYLCRHINSGVCRKFVESDIKLTLNIFDALHEGTHNKHVALSDSELSAIILRVETQLVFLLGLSRKG
jgi:hypothetical protein